MIAAAVERVKSVVVPRKRDTTATLEESLGQLRSMLDEIAKREAFLNDAIQIISQRLTAYAQSGVALDAALSAGDIEGVRVAIDALEAKSDHSTALQQRLRPLTAAASMRVPRDDFLKAHREAKAVLQTVCELRLSEARSASDKVTTEEQSRLDALGEGYEATTSPVVKRANARVARLEGMLTNIENASPESLQTVFVNYGQQLL